MGFFRWLKAALTARPAASQVAAQPSADCLADYTPPRPPLTREEVELALLTPFLSDEERPYFLPWLAEAAWRQPPWPEKVIAKEPRMQLWRWRPFIEHTFAQTQEEALRRWLETVLREGLRSYRTPPGVLSRPMRMYWLLQQGRRAGQVYAVLEGRLGNRAAALDCAWLVITRL